MDRKTGTLVILASLMLLAGCGQSERQAEPSAQPSTDTSSTQPKNDTSEVYEGTISGVISDSMCGSDHTKMGDLGKDPVACIHECVEGGAKYVLVDNKGDVYSLSEQEKSKELAGRSVSIEGHIDSEKKAIHVHSISAGPVR